MSRKRSGERGQPWRSPLSALKKGVAMPLIKREKDIEVRQAMIQFVKDTPNPRWVGSI